MRLVLTIDRPVYGRTMHAGEEFEVPDNEGEAWVKVGWARTVPEDQKRRRGYARRDMRTENVSEMRSEDE